MSSGPVLIFDKSTLEALNVDECVWLSQFFRINITPMFFVETIADLEKHNRNGRDAEDVVARLALKTQAMTADANVAFGPLCAADLAGRPIDMHRVPVRTPGRTVERNGLRGIVFDVGEEARLLSRWQRKQFDQADRTQARTWRQALADLNLRAVYDSHRALLGTSGKPKDESAVKALVDTLVADRALAEATLGHALAGLGVPHEQYSQIHARWISMGKPVLPQFAPYAAHCLRVQLFAALSIGAGVVSWERPSNMADLAYLYYLPFCMVFTSGDKLHLRTAPLFMEQGQALVPAGALKQDLAKLDAHYSALAADVREQGAMQFAQRPPTESGFLVSELWDRFLPQWRVPPKRSLGSEEQIKQLLDQIRQTDAASQESVPLDDAAFVMMEHQVPLRMGKWRFAPKGAENES